MVPGGLFAVVGLAIAAVSLGLDLPTSFPPGSAEEKLAPIRPFIDELVGEVGTLQAEVRFSAGTPIDLYIPLDERMVVRAKIGS